MRPHHRVVSSSCIRVQVLLGRDVLIVRQLALAVDDDVVVEGLINHRLNRLTMLLQAFTPGRIRCWDTLLLIRGHYHRIVQLSKIAIICFGVVIIFLIRHVVERLAQVDLHGLQAR